jgi:hypothetical protein
LFLVNISKAKLFIVDLKTPWLVHTNIDSINGLEMDTWNSHTVIEDTILRGTHPGTIYARFEPYIDASCQVWLHVAKLFQRRRFF